MSSPHLPSDCTTTVQQGPSWDEFDRSEELEENGTSDRETDEQDDDDGHSRSFDPAAPPGFDISASQGGHQIAMDETHHSQSNSSLSYFDQLPNSVNEVGARSPAEEQQYGPSLPPGFMNGSEEDDPEDPGDPEDPDEGDFRSSMPNMSSYSDMATLSDVPSSSDQPNPLMPNSGDIFSPSLPEEETKRHESILLPPPEPGETHMNESSSSTRMIIGPAMPDLLPIVANLGNDSDYDGGDNDDDDDDEEDEDEDEDEDIRDIYGPAVPCDLQNRICASGRRDFDVEVPIDDNEICARGNDGDDNSEPFGPVPPWEQKGNANDDKEDDYAVRQMRLEAQRASKAAAPSRRPEWMTQPPKRLGAYGLTAMRTFSRTNDSAVSEQALREWTETPAERMKRLEQGNSSDIAGPSGIELFEAQRNKIINMVQAQRAALLEESRSESLLDIHQRKRRHGNDENGAGVPIRRPFDRDRDMDDHGIGGALDLSADAIRERCGQLSSRFASSTSRKFL